MNVNNRDETKVRLRRPEAIRVSEGLMSEPIILMDVNLQYRPKAFSFFRYAREAPFGIAKYHPIHLKCLASLAIFNLNVDFRDFAILTASARKAAMLRPGPP